MRSRFNALTRASQAKMKYLFVGTIALLTGYFAFTWFFFGSPHPCGIVEARQRSYKIEKARADMRESRLLAYRMIGSMKPEAADAGVRMLDEINDLLRKPPIDLKRKMALMTPAECTWQAITWSPPKVARYRPLREGEEILPLVEPNVPGATER